MIFLIKLMMIATQRTPGIAMDKGTRAMDVNIVSIIMSHFKWLGLGPVDLPDIHRIASLS